MNNKLLILLSFTVISSFLQAGGFRVSLQGVRQAAMAHTSAHTRDASVAFFNPAGIAFIPNKLSISAGGFAVITKAEYQNPSTLYKAETHNPVSPPFYFGAAYKATDKLSIGLSVTSPFGSSVKWGEDWAGKDLITKIELKAFYFQPTVAYRLTDWLSVGAGFIHVLGSADLEKSISGVNGSLHIQDKDASGNGYNVGLYLKPTQDLDVSIAYRSKVEVDAVNGKADFNIPQSLVGSEKFVTAHDRFNTTIPLASEFTLGITYRISPQWSISSDFNRSGWGVYKDLEFDFYQNKIGNDPKDPTVLSSPRNFKDSNTYRIGAEYSPNQKLDLRLGYYYDESPVSSQYWNPETPSTNNYAVTAGVGYKFLDNLFVDLTGIYFIGEQRNVNNNISGFYGQAKAHSYIFGLGITWNPLK